MRLPIALLTLALPAIAHADGEESPYYVHPAYREAYVAASHWRPNQDDDWYAGVGFYGVHLSSDDVPLGSTGGGVSAWLGLHLTDRFTFELGWAGSLHAAPAMMPTRVFQGLTTDARLYFLRGRLDGYVQVGLGLYFLGGDFGAGAQVGGGFDYWVGDHVTLGTRFVYRAAAISPSEVVDPTGVVTAAMVEVGTSLHF